MRKTALAGLLTTIGASLFLAVSAPSLAQTTQADIPAAPANPNAAPRIPGQNVNGMRVYIRAGLKTHGPGDHDYPQFLADFSKVLTQHGAVVDGSFHFPTAEELKDVSVIVMYKGDTGYLTPVEKANLEAYIKRGGGLVALHDAMCGPDPEYYATILGGAKKHGEVNYTLLAKVPYTIVDKQSPLLKGVTDGFMIQDEAFFNMTWAKSGVKVLATTVIDDTPSARNAQDKSHVGEVVPQIWTYEHTLAGGQPARAFVWMQGHGYANILKPEMTNMLLRGIAWAGKRPVDELADYKQPPQPPRQPRAG